MTVSRSTVLFLTTESGLKGGGEFFLRDAVKGLVPYYNVVCAVPGEGELAACLRSHGAGVIFFQASWSRKWKDVFRNFEGLARARKALRGRHIGVVYANAGHNAPFAVRLARTLRARCIVHVHDIPEARGQQKFLFSKADRVLACSRYVAASITGCHGRLSVIYNGVDTGVFIRKTGAPHERFRIGIMGTVNRKKGLFEFVRMAEFLAPRIPDARFVVIGAAKPGEEDVARELEADVTRRGLGARFEWKGFSPEPQRDLAGIDVLVVPSRYEAFGRVIPEAFACGTPVVATRCGGPEEVIEDGQNGFLCPVDDIEGLGEAVVRLYGDPACYARIAAAARADAERRFSLERMIAGLREIIDGVGATGRIQE